MRLAWRDGERIRELELEPLGSDRFRATLDGASLEIAIERLGSDRLRLRSDQGSATAEITTVGARRFVRLGTMDFVLEREAAGRKRGAASPGGGLEAPMPGVVTRVLVAAGDEVKKGQPLVALEAMKMEHVVRAPRDGRVLRVAAAPGELVNGGVALVELEETG
jgi:3-methylcrotonyl-CoA carboxylase alpha subunit